MNELIRTGKRNTILISISILLVSLHAIYFYHAVRPEIETKKLIQQIIRFLFTSGLLFFLYLGKKWAKIVAVILFSLGIVVGFIAIMTIESSSIAGKIPLFVMIFVYGIAVYHFGISKSYQAFSKFQNE